MRAEVGGGAEGVGAGHRGLVQYDLLAQDVFRLGKLRWVMETSSLKTLAGEHRSTVTKMARKYKATTETPYGPRKCFQVTLQRDGRRKLLVARDGDWPRAGAGGRGAGIPLKRQPTAVLTDLSPVMASVRRNELSHRLLAGSCEICAAQEDLEVHHIRKLADLNRPGRPERPAWMHLMAKRRRKTLAICRPRHENIHVGRAATSVRK